MVAARDLQPGDIIVREKPVVTGPNLDNASSGGSLTESVCLGCYALLQQKTFHPCRKCKAPLCSSSCEESTLHKEECVILKQNPMCFYSTYTHGALVSPNYGKVLSDINGTDKVAHSNLPSLQSDT